MKPFPSWPAQEADFFYVPVYTNLIIIPVSGWGDGPYYYSSSERAPREARPGRALERDSILVLGQDHSLFYLCAAAMPRILHATGMLEEAQNWIQAHYPYWDRKGGRDHIWVRDRSGWGLGRNWGL